jgi:hypothetical protein
VRAVAGAPAEGICPGCPPDENRHDRSEFGTSGFCRACREERYRRRLGECVGCGGRVRTTRADGRGTCGECRRKARERAVGQCRRCRRPAPRKRMIDGVCGRCFLGGLRTRARKVTR